MSPSSQHKNASHRSYASALESQSDAKLSLRQQALKRLSRSLEGFCIPESAYDAARWVVGFSGGVDSSVLLHALTQLPQCPEIVAIHVHHGLSADADDWLAHCEAQCQHLGVSFISEHVTVGADKKASLERAARDARFGVFAKHAHAGDVLFLGHHQNDQAETVLFRLFRGSGVNGLGAMRTLLRRDFDGTSLTLCRPLLSCPQSAVLAYAKAQQLSWIDDESNDNTDFARNFLRHQVLPLVETRWPKAAEKLAQAAQVAQAQQEIVDAWCDAQLRCCIVSESGGESEFVAVGGSVDSVRCVGAVAPRLSMTALFAYPNAHQSLIVQRWAAAAGETLSFHQHKVLSDAMQSASSAFELELAHSVLRVFQSQLFLLDKAFYQSLLFPSQVMDESTAPKDTLTLDTMNRLPVSIFPLQSTSWFGGAVSLQSSAQMSSFLLDARKLEGKHLTVRLRQSTLRKNNTADHAMEAERIRIANRGTRAIKRLLQDVAMLPWLRPVVPLLYADDELVAIAGCAVAVEYEAGDEAVEAGHALCFDWSALG